MITLQKNRAVAKTRVTQLLKLTNKQMSILCERIKTNTSVDNGHMKKYCSAITVMFIKGCSWLKMFNFKGKYVLYNYINRMSIKCANQIHRRKIRKEYVQKCHNSLQEWDNLFFSLLFWIKFNFIALITSYSYIISYIKILTLCHQLPFNILSYIAIQTYQYYKIKLTHSDKYTNHLNVTSNVIFEDSVQDTISHFASYHLSLYSLMVLSLSLTSSVITSCFQGAFSVWVSGAFLWLNQKHSWEYYPTLSLSIITIFLL